MNTKLKINLEVYLRLNIKKKLFSESKSIFLKEIFNTKNKIQNNFISDGDIAVPGTLPLLNKKAILLGIRVTKILNAELANNIEFDRKNWFNYIFPKSYQITQFSKPIGKNGFFNFISNDNKLKKIEIESIILEEEGCESFKTNKGIKINFDTSGTALLKIITKSKFISKEDIKSFFISFIKNMKRFEIINCSLKTYSIWTDINISTFNLSETKYVKNTKIKNINDIENIVNIIELEQKNQIYILEKELENESKKEIKYFDKKSKKLFLKTEKLSEKEYWFIPETNIPTTKIKKDWIDSQNKFIKNY